MKSRLLTLEYHLVDSCNLNCAGCSHYSSLVGKETYMPLEDILNDLALLKNKVGEHLDRLRLLGGEPLLHPQISECLTEIRKLFPKTSIFLITNGLLLKNMKQEFFDACSKSRIMVMMTDYGLIDLPQTIRDLRKQGVIAGCHKEATSWDHQRIRLTEGEIDCLSGCRLKNNCNNYKNGKIYLCPQMAYVKYFNNFFGKDIKIDETDYISLDEVESFDDLIERIDSAKPNFCYQYCNNHPLKVKWGKTKHDINEFCLT